MTILVKTIKRGKLTKRKNGKLRWHSVVRLVDGRPTNHSVITTKAARAATTLKYAAAQSSQWVKVSAGAD